MSIHKLSRDSSLSTADFSSSTSSHPENSLPTLFNGASEDLPVPGPSIPNPLAGMRADIEALLDNTTRREFTNTVNTLTRLGNQKPKLVKPRRQKLRNIVVENKQIAKLYNEYAATQSAMEKRLTYRLPVFADLDVQEYLEMAQLDGAGDNEVGHEQQEEAPHEETRHEKHEALRDDNNAQELELRAVFERRSDGSLALKAAETSRVVERAEQTEAREKETKPDEEAILSTCREETIGHNPVDRTNIEMTNVETSGQTTETIERRRVHWATDVLARTENGSKQIENIQEIALVTNTPAVEGLRGSVSSAPPRYWSAPPTENHTSIMPVINPEAFPISRIQVVQALHYPTAKIANMWTHRNINGDVVELAAEMQSGPVDHLIINDARIITAMGLHEGTNDTISLRQADFKIDETFTIRVLSNQRVQDPEAYIIGELRSARHAYLHWLEFRGSADPRGGPYAQEARRIAVQLGRRAPDIWKEIDGFWKLEQGCGGKIYRENRLRHLGEDPMYADDARSKARANAKSMWG